MAKALACLGKPHDDENISAFFAAFGRTEAGEARHLSQQQFRRYAIFMPPDALQRSDLMLDWIDMDDTVVDTGERAPQLRRASQSQIQSQKTSTPVHIVLLAGGFIHCPTELANPGTSVRNLRDLPLCSVPQEWWAAHAQPLWTV